MNEEKQVDNPQDNTPPNATTPDQGKDNELFAHLGIEASQVDTNVSITKVKELLTNADELKANTKDAIAKMNSKTGKNIVFTCIKRQGYLKDEDGKPLMKKDKNGKMQKVERYIQLKQSGFWTIDKTPDGKYFVVSRVFYYTDSFTIGDYTEIKD